MTDKFSNKTRSKIMSSIRSKNTRPETTIRKILWSMGKRYRIHDKTIFGTPDISNKKKNVAIFIDGCFWHGCQRCYIEPSTNIEFWRNKISKNKKRREKVIYELQKTNWKILTLWEHEIKKNPNKVANSISQYL